MFSPAESDARPHSPSIFTIAPTSSGAFSGSVATATARSGSLRPWPVRVATMVHSPPVKNPSAASFFSPAHDAALAGSQKMPSIEDSSR